ncbi:hypothetical protein L7F22_006047 [Adiantum nelumboides]|nr:hypothetical protein [Adiantum nelumboides]
MDICNYYVKSLAAKRKWKKRKSSGSTSSTATSVVDRDSKKNEIDKNHEEMDELNKQIFLSKLFILPIAINGCLTHPVRTALYKLGELVRWISCKEINPETIVRARDNAIETVCLLEEHFPTSILNIQVHFFVHLVDEVEIAGTVHARWMFFLERFMKTLKGFVRQRARPEGSMAEGWLVQESCVFISEYLSRSQNNALELWSTKDDDRVVGDVPQGIGVVKRFSEEVQTKVSNYCMMNTNGMQKWYELHEKTRQEQIQAREEWNQANRGVPYPEWLRLLPKSMSASWLQGKIASANESGELISLDEQEYAFGPDWHKEVVGRAPTEAEYMEGRDNSLGALLECMRRDGIAFTPRPEQRPGSLDHAIAPDVEMDAEDKDQSYVPSDDKETEEEVMESETDQDIWLQDVKHPTSSCRPKGRR